MGPARGRTDVPSGLSHRVPAFPHRGRRLVGDSRHPQGHAAAPALRRGRHVGVFLEPRGPRGSRLGPLDDAVNYGIGHWRDPSAIFFLNPGTAVNHADKTREAAVMYNHDEPNVGAPASVRPSPRGETYPLAGPRAVHDERRQGRRGNALRLRSRLRPLPLVC